jgi:AAA domain (dynein-related subfamily)
MIKQENALTPNGREESSKVQFPVSPGLKDLGGSVSFLGVELSKGSGGPLTPDAQRFEKEVLTAWDLKLMQKLAVGLELNQPLLLEGGSGIGKSSTVDRMCGYLNREVYYANCTTYNIDTLIGSKTIGKDGSVEWRDGLVSQWLRKGGVLFLDEYNFMGGEVRGRLHEVLDSVLRGTGRVNLTENYSEVIKVHPDCRLIAAQNEPGNDQSDRQVLDAPQLTRFVYIKEVEDLPKEVKLARALGVIGEDNVIALAPEEYLTTYSTKTALKDLPGIRDLITRYVEFAESIEQLIKERTVGSKQPQPVYCSSSRDQARVFNFVEKFYDGDSNGTFQKALRYYYQNKFSSENDREQVGNLIKLVETDLSALPSKRRGLESDSGAKVITSAPLEAVARELGKNFLGPAQWKEAFGVDVGAVPLIPTSITKELLISDCPIEPGKKIKETHVLMLVPKTVNGKPYSALKLDELCSTTKGSGDKLIDDGYDSWKGQSWASTEQAASEWVLIPKRDPDSAKVISDKHFRSKDIAAQDDVLSNHYKEYREVKTLEVMTMALLYDLTHKEQLLPDWLRCEEPNASGGRVCVGCLDAVGLEVRDDRGGNVRGYIGRALARKLKT